MWSYFIKLAEWGTENLRKKYFTAGVSLRVFCNFQNNHSTEYLWTSSSLTGFYFRHLHVVKIHLAMSYYWILQYNMFRLLILLCLSCGLEIKCKLKQLACRRLIIDSHFVKTSKINNIIKIRYFENLVLVLVFGHIFVKNLRFLLIKHV